MKLLHPEYFQGKLTSQNYFEGWYFKHVSQDLTSVLSIIPGVALNADDPHAFIQILNGITGESVFVRYALQDCELSSSHFYVRIGASTFSDMGISLDIDTPTLRLKGQLRYTDMVRYPSTPWSPGIMGWYSFVPRMECKHAVISMRHVISGQLLMNDQVVNFDGGTGYIEKDWGSSFPESWVWVQGNTFVESDASFMLSVAKIPWLGHFFVGTIAYLYVKGKTYVFATYDRSTVSHLSFHDHLLTFELKHPRYILSGEIRQHTRGQLHAPVSGVMTRMIKESADADITLQLRDRRGQTLFQDRGAHGGLEIIEAILTYFPEQR